MITFAHGVMAAIKACGGRLPRHLNTDYHPCPVRLRRSCPLSSNLPFEIQTVLQHSGGYATDVLEMMEELDVG